MDRDVEPIYVIEDWYDGPRTGVAEYGGVPHYYRSLYLDRETWNPDEDRFELTPLTAESVAWAVEADRLFHRWDDARQAGTLPPDATEESLDGDAPLVYPADRARFELLERQLHAYLEEARGRAFVVRGESRGRGFRWLPRSGE